MGAVGHVGEGRDAKAGDIGGSRGVTTVWWCWLTTSPSLLPGPFIDQRDELRRCLSELDPLTLMPGLDTTHARRDIMNDPMLEEFIASLAASRAMRGPSLGRLPPTLVTAPPQDEVPSEANCEGTCAPPQRQHVLAQHVDSADLACFGYRPSASSTKCPAQLATDPPLSLEQG